jgi:hypothetical protein
MEIERWKIFLVMPKRVYHRLLGKWNAMLGK